MRPFKNAQFCSSSRKAKILTTGIHGVFRGLKFEPDAEIGQISADFEPGRFGIGSYDNRYNVDLKSTHVQFRFRRSQK